MTPPINSDAQWVRDTAVNVMLCTEVEEATRILSLALARRAANTPVDGVERADMLVKLARIIARNIDDERYYSAAPFQRAADEILTLLSPTLPSQVVGVKELVWGEGDKAVTPFGAYQVVRTDDGYALTFEHEELVHIGFNSVEPFQSPRNEAMSRAQPDFNARIQSCLTSPAAERPCTCHPDDNPPQPCAQKFALADCLAAAEPVPDFWALWTVSGAHVGTWAVQETALRVAQEYRDCTIVPLYTHPAPSASREVTEADIERAAEVIWNDLYGARAGAWNNPPANSVSAIQIRATARAALLAALPGREGSR